MREISTETDPGAAPDAPSLKRTIGPAQMALYGLGSMLGAGIYGLIGKAAGQAGNAVWLSFVVALVAALLTALSYASLGSRYPRAAGAAYVTERAYGFPLLSFMTGLALVCSGLTSIATQSQVFAANIAALFGLESVPLSWLALGFLLILTGIVFRGIRESMWVNVLCTLIEAGGLVLVIIVGASYWGSVDYLETPALPGGDHAALLVMQAAVLAFFAFIGFEDMINVAEETRDPERTVPLGLILAMAAAAVLYISVAVTAVSVVPWKELAAAPGPITAVMERAAPTLPPVLFTAITLFAVANTALVNYVTASRLVYGMARQGLLPQRLGDVHAARRTPHLAVAVAVSRACAACASRHDHGTCRGDRASPAFRVHGGQWRALHPEGTRRREARPLRDTARDPGIRRSHLSHSDRGAGCDRRLAGACARGRAPIGRLRPPCLDTAEALEPVRRVALVAPPVQPAHIGDCRLGALGLHFERRNQGILGPDHEPVAPPLDSDSDRELRLHTEGS